MIARAIVLAWLGQGSGTLVRADGPPVAGPDVTIEWGIGAAEKAAWPALDRPVAVPDHDLYLEWVREAEAEPGFFEDALWTLLSPATFAVEGLSWLLMPRRVELHGQILFEQGGAGDDFGKIFLRTLVEREASFLAGLSTSYVATIGVEEGLEEVDDKHFKQLQHRVIFDSLKRAYRERFHVPRMELDTVVSVFTTGEWYDALLVPAAVSLYAARFGIERKIHVADDVKVAIRIEKGTRIYKVLTEDTHRRVASLSVTLFNLPVSFMVVIDGGDGKFDFGFVGVGTDLNAVIEAIYGSR